MATLLPTPDSKSSCSFRAQPSVYRATSRGLQVLPPAGPAPFAAPNSEGGRRAAGWTRPLHWPRALGSRTREKEVLAALGRGNRGASLATLLRRIATRTLPPQPCAVGMVRSLPTPLPLRPLAPEEKPGLCFPSAARGARIARLSSGTSANHTLPGAKHRSSARYGLAVSQGRPASVLVEGFGPAASCLALSPSARSDLGLKV